jgi:hypothetical protein
MVDGCVALTLLPALMSTTEYPVHIEECDENLSSTLQPPLWPSQIPALEVFNILNVCIMTDARVGVMLVSVEQFRGPADTTAQSAQRPWSQLEHRSYKDNDEMYIHRQHFQ